MSRFSINPLSVRALRRASLPAMFFAVVLSLGMVAGLTACRAKTPPFVSPYVDLSAFFPETVERVTQVLSERHPALSTLKTESDITVSMGKKGRQRFHGNLLVELPDKARLRGSRAALGTLFEILSVGDQLEVFFNRDGELFVGRRSDLSDSAGILRLVGPDQLLRALLAERDLAERLQKPGTWKVQNRQAHWLLSTTIPGGDWQIWVVRKRDFLVEESLVGTAAGGARARIRFFSYDVVDGEPLPTDLEIRLADPDVTVRVEVDEVLRNPPLGPQVFQAPPVAPTHRHPLSQLRFEGPGEGE